jgi:hypothetical protein
MMTKINRETYDLLARVHEEGLASNSQRAAFHDKAVAGRSLNRLDDNRYELRNDFDVRFFGEREIDFPGTTALYRDIAEHGIFRNLMIKGRIEPHERRIYEEFTALFATLTPVDMVPAALFITPDPLSPVGRIALVNEVLEHGIDSKETILNAHNDGLNDGELEAAAAVRIDRGLRFHAEFFAETQDPDNDLFRDILENGVVSEEEYAAIAEPYPSDIDGVRRHFQLGDYRDVLVEEAADAPFEVTGRELIVARARVNGVIDADEYKRLTRLVELGSRMTEKQIRQCAEYEAFVAEFGNIADEKAEGLPYSAWHAISFGLVGEAERDESLRREAAIDRDRWVNDDDYDPRVTPLDSMRAARHDQFLAAADATFTPTPPRPEVQPHPSATTTAAGRLAIADYVLGNGLPSEHIVAATLDDIANGLPVESGRREAAERHRLFVEAFADAQDADDLLAYVIQHGLLSRDEYASEYSDSGTPGYCLSAEPLRRYEEFRALVRNTLEAEAAPKVEGEIVALNEDSRTYLFANRDIELTDVRELIVRDSGTHRVRTADGRLHVIAPGWLAITIVDSSQEWTA